MNRLLFGIIAVLVSISALFARTTGQRLYYVEGAQLSLLPSQGKRQDSGWNPQACQRILQESHSLSRGEKLVLVLRKWDRVSIWREDDDTYEDLSIEIDKPEFGPPIPIGALNVQFRYSAGRTNGVDRCEGVFSTVGSGYLILSQGQIGRLTAELDLNLQPQDVGTFTARDSVSIRSSFTFDAVSLEFLQAGLG